MAVRGRSRRSASSPKALAARELPQLAAVRLDLELALRDDRETVTALALAHDGLAGGDAYLHEPVCERLELRRSERREHR